MLPFFSHMYDGLPKVESALTYPSFRMSFSLSIVNLLPGIKQAFTLKTRSPFGTILPNSSLNHYVVWQGVEKISSPCPCALAAAPLKPSKITAESVKLVIKSSLLVTEDSAPPSKSVGDSFVAELLKFTAFCNFKK